jgi:uncharacterized protein DUF6968
MNEPIEWIASRELAASDAARGDFEIVIRLGKPYRISDIEWACAVALEGLQLRRDVHGGDSFQALMLAQHFARTILDYFVEGGGTLREHTDGRSVNLESLFASGVCSPVTP